MTDVPNYRKTLRRTTLFDAGQYFFWVGILFAVATVGVFIFHYPGKDDAACYLAAVVGVVMLVVHFRVAANSVELFASGSAFVGMAIAGAVYDHWPSLVVYAVALCGGIVSMVSGWRAMYIANKP